VNDREGRSLASLVGEQTSDHAPIESVYGTVCRTCVTWLSDDYETGEFGIAIPVQWPCGVSRAYEALAGAS
jgi:hypothetical protein